jgi:vitamin B12 transporter
VKTAVRCFVVGGLFLPATAAFGQAQLSEYSPCPDEYDEETREYIEFNPIHGCTIHVTGNLPQSRVEKTETISSLSMIDGSLETSLLKIPGLQQFRRSDSRTANPTSQGVTLRGLGGNAASRVLVTLDDVPQADPFGGWISWPSYDALHLVSVRLRKGGGLVASGVGAMAGVIELDSYQNADYREVGVKAGNGGDISGRALFGLRQGAQFNRGNSLTGGISYSGGRGFAPVMKSQRGAVDRESSHRQISGTLRAVLRLNDSSDVQASLRAFSDRRDRGVNFSDSTNGGVDTSLRIVSSEEDWDWSATAYLQLREFTSQFGAISADRNVVNPTLDQFSTPSTGMGARFEARPELPYGYELRIGGEWRRTVGRTREYFSYVGVTPTRLRSAGGAVDTLGGFVEATLRPVDALTVTAGGRVDGWQIQNGTRREVNIGSSTRSDDRFLPRDAVEWAGRAGLAWSINGALSLRASAYSSWRLPTLNELYRPFRVGADATAANELLQPERLQGVEAGLEYSEGDSTVKIGVFHNRLRNAIANVTLGAGPGNFPGVGFVAGGGVYRQRQNLDAIVSTGAEVDVLLALTQQLDFRLNYAFADATVSSSGASTLLNGLRPAQVPRHFASASLDLGLDNFEVRAALYYIGNQFEDDANSRSLNDALTADLSVEYEVADYLYFSLRAQNVFNARVEAAISGSGIVERANPRTLWLGASWKFS